ncbi:hypothetical protein VSU19_12330 [Verrucomicrobiales bacterium BCK34]|nr:hypothetical protein [Verrucomicrobiales bacterium BCK34]
MNFPILPIAIFAVSISFECFCAEADWVEYFPGDESWPTFKSPKGLILNDKSFTGEQFKWIALYESNDKELLIEISPFGFVSERFRDEEGFETPRDVVLVFHLQNAKRIKRPDCEVFIEHQAGEASAFFLRPNGDWGRCYDKITVKDSRLNRNEALNLILRIVEEFRPSFTKNRKLPR